jgi:ATP-dependent exoDNAse (exonuclease V) alpha subunit
MATTVREGGCLEIGEYGSSRVIHVNDAGNYVADQVLVGRNYTRRNINKGLRARQGRYGLPVRGDKLVCLRNDYRRGLLNGSLWKVDQSIQVTSDGELMMRIISEDDCEPVTVMTHVNMFDGRASELEDEEDYSKFDFGYALTVHKAQGSQWGSVVLFDEGHCFGDDYARWLYTGITRAAERITVIIKE